MDPTSDEAGMEATFDKPTTMAEILAAKKRIVKTVQIQLDSGIALRLEELQEQRAQAVRDDRRMNRNPLAPGIERQIEELTEQARDTVVEFKFGSIGRAAFEKLMRAHKPDQEDKKEGSVFNTKTFPPILVAATSIEPEINEEQAKQMFNSPEWNQGELLKLFTAAMLANSESPDIPLSNSGSEPMPAIELKSNSASTAESPTPTSSDE